MVEPPSVDPPANKVDAEEPAGAGDPFILAVDKSATSVLLEPFQNSVVA